MASNDNIEVKQMQKRPIPTQLSNTYEADEEQSQDCSNDQLYVAFCTCLYFASCAHSEDNEEEADRFLMEAMRLAWRISNRQTSRLAIEICCAKRAHFDRQYRQAAEMYLTAMTMYMLANDHEDLALADILGSLAELHFIEGNYSSARASLSWSIKIEKRILGNQAHQLPRKIAQLDAVDYANHLAGQRDRVQHF